MTNYSNFKYLFAPRPEAQCKPESLHKFSSGDYMAQVKTNGSCATLYVNDKGEWQLWDRHKTVLPSLKLPFHELKPKQHWNVFAGEYLNKNKRGESDIPFNHKFIVWDLLVREGEYLTGTTFEQRTNMLIELLPCQNSVINSVGKLEAYEYLCCTDHKDIYRAPVYVNGNYEELYKSIVKTDCYEGVVLKRRTAKLEHGYNAVNNSSWQVKCRKKTKNYAF